MVDGGSVQDAKGDERRGRKRRRAAGGRVTQGGNQRKDVRGTGDVENKTRGRGKRSRAEGRR